MTLASVLGYIYRASWTLLVILPFDSEDKMGRAKQIRPETNRLEAETAERDNLPESSLLEVDVIPKTQQDPLQCLSQQSSEDEATRQ